ncbi:SWIB/MDM2 domain-containing protein [Chlamydia trachomatis]|uniref:SWIB/MDM2 domain-containing protein n=1 Tax=Chlamydia trachomatis TaxID=813 RepID=UPI00061C361F|nr:SWIB/MDM2 domain-containing protein [Chlamydia trachomatis]CRH25107.1 SwiB complex protein [Chlamydia trachomatis]
MSQNKNSAFMQPVNVSADLAAIVGAGPMPRTEIIKKMWDYIKENGLQDPTNKRNIMKHEPFSQVFGTEKPIDMFQMTKMVSQHIIK